MMTMTTTPTTTMRRPPPFRGGGHAKTMDRSRGICHREGDQFYCCEVTPLFPSSCVWSFVVRGVRAAWRAVMMFVFVFGYGRYAYHKWHLIILTVDTYLF